MKDLVDDEELCRHMEDSSCVVLEGGRLKHDGDQHRLVLHGIQAQV